ncbi:hypothetical protein CCP4SC76_6030003 [Gammaproteobacteria bacterium]
MILIAIRLLQDFSGCHGVLKKPFSFSNKASFAGSLSR